MSECPYSNFQNKIYEYIKFLSTPRNEYSGMAPCPFVAKELYQDKLMIEIFDPSSCSIIDMVKKFKETKYESALFVQVTEKDIPATLTYDYQCFINKLLRNAGYDSLKCICLNPNDNHNIEGFNVRKNAPYFLINIADKRVLSKAHKSLLNTKYFNKMNKEYLDYLHIKKTIKEEK